MMVHSYLTVTDIEFANGELKKIDYFVENMNFVGNKVEIDMNPIHALSGLFFHFVVHIHSTNQILNSFRSAYFILHSFLTALVQYETHRTQLVQYLVNTASSCEIL